MSVRSSAVRLLLRTALVLGGVLAVTILLAAMPRHNAPAVESNYIPLQQASESQDMQGMDHSKMDANAEKASEDGAVAAMNHMAGGAHMHMTEMRPHSAEDEARAKQIVADLRSGIAKYKDYHVALDDGYRIFLPNVPQPEYHFTNYKNGFLASLYFDPSQPTSLLYRKTSDGYELVGAMYTMPKRATEQQLDERVPLSVAMWHLHTNLCMPPGGRSKSADWTRFGLKGSIATEDACDAAGGKFYPVIFGWMVHVYPYEDSLDKVFAMHRHD